MNVATNLASPTQRILAHTLDSIVLVMASYGGGFLGAMVASLMSGGSSGPLNQAAYNENLQIGFLFGGLFWAYTAFFLNFFIYQGLTGSSVGKQIIRLKVVRADGLPIDVPTACFRGLYFILSSMIFYLGFLWIYINRRHQAWHDILAKTVVISNPRLAAEKSIQDDKNHETKDLETVSATENPIKEAA